MGFASYSNLEIVHRNPHSVFYKAYTQTGKVVLVKTLRNHLDVNKIEKLEREFEIVNLIGSEGIIKYIKIEKDYNCHIVLENFEGIPLNNFVPKEGIHVNHFLRIAIPISGILNDIHLRGIIHKELALHNWMINPLNLTVKLIDFPFTFHDNNEFYQVDPNYISPEQVGRSNRGLDHRTDFYSLGISFFELITGRKPFESEDPQELIHQHLAKSPPLLKNINPEVPDMVSNIILKLLSKNADDRYQSALGLTNDLKECLDQLERHHVISTFTLGFQDFPSKIEISEKLCGREKYMHLIENSFIKVINGKTGFILIKGDAGVGKTFLVKEASRTIIKDKAYFISGKFDLDKSGTPYYGIIQALNKFIYYISTLDKKRVDRWKEIFINFLTPNTSLISEFLPAIKILIDEGPYKCASEANQNKSLFIDIIKEFISSIVDEKKPLVIFLDDLQWADPDSLQILQQLDIPYLLLIAAYRPNEVNDLAQAFILDLKKLPHTQETCLEPFANNETVLFVGDILNSFGGDLTYFSNLVYDKTLGNPFYIVQLLKALNEEGYIWFNTDTCNWDCSIIDIKKYQSSHNVIDLVISRINKLSNETIDVLKVAACIGRQFDLQMVSSVYGESSEKVCHYLDSALKQNFILLIDEQFLDKTSNFEKARMNKFYSFIHDRVQHAIFEEIPLDKKKELHYSIGKIRVSELRTKVSDIPNERIFEIVKYLGYSTDYQKEERERNLLIELCYEAGRKSRRSSAFQAAIAYFLKGMELLSPDSEISTEELSFNLYLDYAECEYILGNNDRSLSVFSDLLNQNRTSIQKIKIYDRQVRLYIKANDIESAIKAGKMCLRIFRIWIPESGMVLGSLLIKELIRAKAHFIKARSKDLGINPLIKDEETIELVKFMETFSIAAFSKNPLLFGYIIFKALNIILKHGNCSSAPAIFIGYGMILSTVFRNYKSAYEMGELALNLEEKLGDDKLLNFKVKFPYYTFLFPLKRNIRLQFKYLLDIHKESLEDGDPLYSGYAITNMIYHKVAAGYNIDDVLEENEKFIEHFSRRKEKEFIDVLKSKQQFLLTLKGKTYSCYTLSDLRYNEVKEIDESIKSKSLYVATSIYISKIQLAFLFDYEDQLKIGYYVKRFEKLKNTKIGYAFIDFYLYQALLLLKFYKRETIGNKLFYKRIIRRNHRILRKHAKLCASNYEPFLLTLEAQLSFYSKRMGKAEIMYEKAIESSAKYNFIQIQALVNELAGEYYLKKQNPKRAGTYIKEAYICYAKWGAIAKVHDMERKHGRYLSNGKSDFLNISSAHSNYHFSNNDISSLLKASEAISENMNYDVFLNKLMKIVIQYAGAQQGFLILKHGDTLVIEAAANINNEEVRVFTNNPIENTVVLPKSIINYVIQEQQIKVINEAYSELKSEEDPYFLKHAPRSIFCIPIIKGIVTGALYLENNLIPNAFNPENTKLLTLLSKQIAIAMENAVLQKKRIEEVKNNEVLVQQQNLQEKMLLKEIIDTQETERKRIAEDLHDGLGCILSTIKLQLTSFVESSNKDEKEISLSKCFNLIEESFKELKSISFNLMPEALLEKGLIPAIKELCTTIAKSCKVEIKFNHFNFTEISHDHEVTIFRILQEIINNALKHAQATFIEMQFVYHDDLLIITIEDNGKGFDFEEKMKSNLKGRGLTHILNRVTYLKGEINYDSVEGKGTSILIKIPI